MASMFAYCLQFKTESYKQAICQNPYSNVYWHGCLQRHEGNKNSSY